MALAESAAEAAPHRTHPRSPARLALTVPAGAVEGEVVQIKVHASLSKSLRPVKGFVLSFGDGTTTLRGRVPPKRAVTHTYAHAGHYAVALAVLDAAHKRHVVRRTIVITGKPTPSSTPPAPAASQVATQDQSQGPAAPAPLELVAGSVELPPGSVTSVATPAPLAVVSSVTAVSGEPAGAAATAAEGQLQVTVDAGVSPQSATLAVSGLGCVGSECDRPFTLRVPLRVTELAAPPGQLDAFTAASPDRVAAGEELPVVGVRLRDELLVTLGTPDAPGTREEAEAMAAYFGAVVSGGIEEIGVYELRWEEPQDLETIKQEIESWVGVTAAASQPSANSAPTRPRPATGPTTVRRRPGPSPSAGPPRLGTRRPAPTSASGSSTKARCSAATRIST